MLANQPQGVPLLYLSEEVVRRSIESAWETFEPCGDAALESTTLPEPLTVSFVIERNGLVSSATPDNNQENTAYSECLTQALTTIDFPQHWENPLALRYVFTMGSAGLIKYPRIPLPQRSYLPIGLGFFGLTPDLLHDLLFGAESSGDNIE